jgi:hypothetical protein
MQCFGVNMTLIYFMLSVMLNVQNTGCVWVKVISIIKEKNYFHTSHKLVSINYWLNCSFDSVLGMTMDMIGVGYYSNCLHIHSSKKYSYL